MNRDVTVLLRITGGVLLAGILGLLLFYFLLAPDGSPGVGPESEATADTGDARLPNPASVYCKERGGRLAIRTAADGSQVGVCMFPDGGECEEWAFYRGECGLTVNDRED